MPFKKLVGYAVLTVILFSCNREQTLFTSLSPSQTNISFENTLPERDHLNILYYLYYYNGGGVSIGDINNDSLPDIYFTANNTAKNKLYLNKGNLQFEDITEKAGVQGLSDWCSGSTMADVNGDGFLDIYVSVISQAHGLEGYNELYINNGNGTFTESAKQYGIDFSGFSTQAAFFDYDRDGDLDCYLLNQSQKPNQNIVDTSNRRKFDATQGDRFFRNEGNGKFTDVSSEAGIYQSNLGYGLGIAVADFNNDGWDDIYVGNDFHENDYYYLNNGNGTFSESGAKHFGHYSRFSMGNDAADFNNDGHLDLITVDMLPPDEKVLKTYGSDENADIFKLKLEKNGFQYQCSRNCLQRNNGNGESFSETALISGVSATDWSWAPLLADFDNDGNKDLFISSGIVKRPVDLDYIRFVSDLYVKKNHAKTDKYDDEALDAMPDGASMPFFFKGDGNLAFTDVSKDWGTAKMKGYFNGAAYGDLDNDGDLDLVINSLNAPARILQNNSQPNNYISLRFEGPQGNRFGIGAKAYITNNGKLQYQQLMLTRGFQSSSDTRLHFAFDSAATNRRLLIVWPDQKYQVLENFPLNGSITASYQNAKDSFTQDLVFPKSQQLLSAHDIRMPWQHRENDFNDFNIQYLIPHALSTRGPKTTVADVNGDGLDDMFTCGALGQPGALMLQQRNGSFVLSDTALFGSDRQYEDVDALFFDANGDGRTDLYVASGGNQHTGDHPALADRLYINNGKGQFSKSTDALPNIFANKGCVAAADVDKDGDNDIFVGTIADAKAYGISQTSYLLLNDGTGKFSVAPQQTISLASTGMVTSAVFADIDRDGWTDLAVAGEWMPITIFKNRNGRFEKNELPNSTGLWQTLLAEDADGDGNVDLLCGNWGWNNKFKSGKDGPLKLYVSDYDNNGQIDQLMSYTVQGKEYPFLAKDEVERPLPLLKKHYLRYSEYAGVVMKDVFYGWIDTITPLTAERLGSAICFGDGKGNFDIRDLPAELQLSPIMTFFRVSDSAQNRKIFLAGGNFFDVIPYEGKYDGQPLSAFSVQERNVVQYSPNTLPFRWQQVRHINGINTTNGRKIVVAPNNDSLRFFTYNKDQ